MSDVSLTLPDGVVLHRLVDHADDRGVLRELYRQTWPSAPPVAQINLVRSFANCLRGLHVHVENDDWLSVVSGRLLVGLLDVRPASLTFGRSVFVTLDADLSASIHIPKGVAHGFYNQEAATYLYTLSRTWAPGQSLIIDWRDPETGLNWPCTSPNLSQQDRLGRPLAALREVFAEVLSGATA